MVATPTRFQSGDCERSPRPTAAHQTCFAQKIFAREFLSDRRAIFSIKRDSSILKTRNGSNSRQFDSRPN
jgi:hypothetical protein